MYEIFKLSDVVALESQYLDSNIQQHLEKEVKKQFIGRCSQAAGYIVEIKDISIQSSEISMADSTNRFTVTFTAYTIFPKTGNIYKSLSLEDIVNHDCFNGALMNVYEFVAPGSKDFSNNELLAYNSDDHLGNPRANKSLACIQIFVTNGTKKQDTLVFSDCNCVINCNKLPISCVIDIIVDFSKYKNGQFCITGRHIH